MAFQKRRHIAANPRPPIGGTEVFRDLGPVLSADSPLYKRQRDSVDARA